MGALPTVYAATQDLPGGSYVGPTGEGAARVPDAGRPVGRGQRHQAGRGAVDGLRGADRSAVPALTWQAANRSATSLTIGLTPLTEL